MGWNYDPKNIPAKGAPVGTWEAMLAIVDDTTSKKGNPMRMLGLIVYTDAGEQKVRDYFVEGNAFATRRMRDVAFALGAEKDWEAGTFDAANYLNSSLQVEIVHDEGDEYTRVGSYMASTVGAGAVSKPARPSVSRRAAPPKANETIEEDDIPF